jgi:hypothetical protein
MKRVSLCGQSIESRVLWVDGRRQQSPPNRRSRTGYRGRMAVEYISEQMRFHVQSIRAWLVEFCLL